MREGVLLLYALLAAQGIVPRRNPVAESDFAGVRATALSDTDCADCARRLARHAEQEGE